MLVRSRLTILGLLVCVVLLFGVSSVAAAPRYLDRAQLASAGQVDSRIVASFRAFRRPRTRADALPASVSLLGPCPDEVPGNLPICGVNQTHPFTPPGQPPKPGQQADAADGWQLPIYGQQHVLQMPTPGACRSPTGSARSG